MKTIYKLVAITLFVFLNMNLISQDFWEEVTLPVPGSIVYALGINDNGLVVMGQSNAIFYSSDYGDNWTESTNWPGYFSKCIGFNSSDDIFVGTQSDGILRSTDGGITFTGINNGLSFLNVWCILILDNDDILLGTPGGIFKSTDNGNNWAQFGIGLPDDEIEHLIITDNGDLFAGTYESGVYWSTDGGQNWSERNGGLPDNAMVTAMLEGADDDLFTATFPEGIFHSTDNGNLWEPFNNGLPFDKLPSENPSFSVVMMIVLIAIVFVFIYYFGCYWLNMFGPDMDYAWMELSGGLPDEISISCVGAGGPDNRMLIGTYEHGLYRNALAVDIDETSKVCCDLSISNYPNPFGHTTTFNISIPETGFVTIRIYNQLGQEVETVLYERLEKGKHQIEWSAKGYTSGIYYYKVSSGNITRTDKIFIR